MLIYALILSFLFSSNTLQTVGRLIFRTSNDYSNSTPPWPNPASHFPGHLLVQQLAIIQSEDMPPMDHISNRNGHFCVGVKLTDHIIMTATSCLTFHNITSIKRLNEGSVLSIRVQSAHHENSKFIHSEKIKIARYECINVNSDITLFVCNESKPTNEDKLIRNTENFNVWMSGPFIRSIVFDSPTKKLIQIDIPIESRNTLKISTRRFNYFSTDNESETTVGVPCTSTYNIWCVLHC